jgi:hypothetical protein
MSVREEYDQWVSLVNHPKWKELKEIAEQQKAVRIASVLNGMDNTREEDKQRGEVLGIALVLESPDAIIKTLEVELDTKTEE